MQNRTRALTLLPIIGLLQGVLLAFVDRSSSACGVLLQSVIVVASGVIISKAIGSRGIWRTFSRKASAHTNSSGLFALIVAVLVLTLEVYFLSRIGTTPSRGRALVLAMMLSRWSVVPIGYGLRVTGAKGLGISFDGAITFRDFGISSVIALGLAMTAYDFIALIVIVMLAFTILGLRFVFSRFFGGVDGYALGAGAQFCELATIAVLTMIRV